MDYVFDIDGTLADITHRRKYVASKPKNWKAFNAGMSLDVPNVPVVQMCKLLHTQGHTIVLCSGRGSEQRGVTETWLAKHGILYHALYMRAEKDYRADYIVKEELLDQLLNDGYNPITVFDDRDQVVEMWRRRGLTCFQVAPGNF